MEVFLFPILIPAGLLSLWIKHKRTKSIGYIWDEHDIHTISTEGMGFLLGTFSVVMGTSILLILLTMIILFVFREIS